MAVRFRRRKDRDGVGRQVHAGRRQGVSRFVDGAGQGEARSGWCEGRRQGYEGVGALQPVHGRGRGHPARPAG